MLQLHFHCSQDQPPPPTKIPRSAPAMYSEGKVSYGKDLRIDAATAFLYEPIMREARTLSLMCYTVAVVSKGWMLQLLTTGIKLPVCRQLGMVKLPPSWCRLMLITTPRYCNYIRTRHYVKEKEDQCPIGPAVRADFRRLYPANAKTPTCCPSDDNRTKVTNSVTSARSLLVARWPVFLARGSDADGEPHFPS